MTTRSKCQGKIRRNYGEYHCDQYAAYAVRTDKAIIGSCRQHLAQVIDSTGAAIAEVIPIAH
jgi:hypothetical protein